MAKGEKPELTVDRVKEVPDSKPGRRPSNFYTNIAQEAFRNPAEWVVLRGFKSSATGTNMRQGKYPAIDPDDYDIEVRRNADGVLYDIYLKYVGKVVEKRGRR